MSKSVWLLAFVFIATVAAPTSSHAGFEQDMGMMTLTVGYVAAKLAPTGENLRGGAFLLGYERVVNKSGLTLGFSAGFLRAAKDVSSDSTSVQIAASAFPLIPQLKYYINVGEGAVKLFGGFGLGVSFTSLEAIVEGNYSNRGESSFVFNVPVGGVIGLSKELGLTANYTYHYFEGSDLIEEHVHTFNAGFSFFMD